MVVPVFNVKIIKNSAELAFCEHLEEHGEFVLMFLKINEVCLYFSPFFFSICPRRSVFRNLGAEFLIARSFSNSGSKFPCELF